MVGVAWAWRSPADDAALVRRVPALRSRRRSARSPATTRWRRAPDARRARAAAGRGVAVAAGDERSTARVVAGLLCTSESRELRRQVETLRESRSAVLDVEASELHRIERDLHDGAQQRLVMLTIDLGLASERIDTDPAAAKAAHPRGPGAGAPGARRDPRPRARDRAVDPARPRARAGARVRSPAAARCRRSSGSDLAAGERLPAAIERAAYFVVAEALANVAKHSGASALRGPLSGARARGWSSRSGTTARGGARVEPGGGLAGLASRVAGVDGTFTVSQPGRRPDDRPRRDPDRRVGPPTGRSPR